MSKGQQHLYTSVLGAQIFDFFLFLSSCNGRVVTRKGNATSDNVCEAIGTDTLPKTYPKDIHTKNASTTASTVMSTVSYSKTLRGPTNSTPSISTSVSEAGFNQTTKSPPPSTASAKTVGTVTDWVFRSSHYEKAVKSDQCLNIFLFCRLCCFFSVSCSPFSCHWSYANLHCHHSAVPL